MQEVFQPIKREYMNKAIVISPHVINTLRALPSEERINIATAIAGEILLGNETFHLEPIESMIFSIIRFYIEQDSYRYQHEMQ